MYINIYICNVTSSEDTTVKCLIYYLITLQVLIIQIWEVYSKNMLYTVTQNYVYKAFPSSV